MILGITGGIASGKSSVSRLLAAYALAPLIDLDACCRDLLDKGQSGWQALHDAFGARYELPGGAVDRAGLREALFADDDLRRQVDNLIHPLALERLRRELERHTDAPLVLVEIPLLYEAGWDIHVDAVLVVHVRPALQLCRLLKRDGVSRRQARQALAAQMPLAEKAKRADYVIENGRDWPVVRRAVIALADTFCGAQ